DDQELRVAGARVAAAVAELIANALCFELRADLAGLQERLVAGRRAREHFDCDHPAWCAVTGEGDPEAAPVRPPIDCRRGNGPLAIRGHWCETHDAEFLLSESRCSGVTGREPIWRSSSER